MLIIDNVNGDRFSDGNDLVFKDKLKEECTKDGRNSYGEESETLLLIVEMMSKTHQSTRIK